MHPVRICLFVPVLISAFVAASDAVIPGRPGVPSTQPLPGVICRVWRNVTGAQIIDSLSDGQLNQPCDETRMINQLEFAPNSKSSWACTMTAMIIPPRTGAYWFNIAARDSGILYLSTDESAAHLRFIAETPSYTDLHNYKWYSAQLSHGIRLVAGQRYLIQAICQSSAGPGGISIAWHMPGGIFQAPIPANQCIPVTTEIAPPSQRADDFRFSLKPAPPPTTQPGLQTFERGAQIEANGQSSDMSYLMFMPWDYYSTTDIKPMLVFLHGNDCQGFNLKGPESNGPIRSMKFNYKLNKSMPMIVMCPQLPPEWRWDTPGAAQAVNALVHQLEDRYPRIDRKRIYLTGLSMGGRGTWLTLENSPQTYAAAVPISAVDVKPDQAPKLLADLPEIHIVCGSDDNGFTAGSHVMFDALKPALGDRVQLTVYDHEGHGVWNHLYNDKAFYEWLLKFSR